MIDLKDDKVFYVQLLIALGNLGLFGLVFGLMGYFELIGSDPDYYDPGTLNNVAMINLILGFVGIHFDAETSHRVSTLMWSTLLGISLISSYFAIVLSNRKPIEEYEVTEAKR